MKKVFAWTLLLVGTYLSLQTAYYFSPILFEKGTYQLQPLGFKIVSPIFGIFGLTYLILGMRALRQNRFKPVIIFGITLSITAFLFYLPMIFLIS